MNRFNPGKVVATPVPSLLLRHRTKSRFFDYLARHLSGDWGVVDANDARKNELGLKQSWRLLSAYTRRT